MSTEKLLLDNNAIMHGLEIGDQYDVSDYWTGDLR